MADSDADLITEQNELFKRATGNTPFPKQVAYKIPMTANADDAVTATDELALFQIPVGAVVRPELSTIVFNAGTSITTSGTITIGDVTDPNRYCVTLAGIHAATAPARLFHSATAPAGFTTPYTIPAVTSAGVDDGRLLLTLAAIGGGSWAAGESLGEITLVVDLP